MNAEQYEGRSVIVKSTGQQGIIKSVSTKLNGQKIRTARFIVDDANGRPVEYMPHEVEILEAQVVSEK